MSEVTKCPYCKGDLIKTAEWVQWRYECKRCGRGWIVLDGKYWLACFDAGGHIYKIENGKIEDLNSYKDADIRKKLWDRVREA